jgi:hypothetical protein
MMFVSNVTAPTLVKALPSSDAPEARVIDS